MGKEKDTITMVGMATGVKWGWISGDTALLESTGITWAGPITGAAGNISDIHNPRTISVGKALEDPPVQP